MRNNLKGRTLSMILAFLLVLSSQTALSQTIVIQSQEQVAPVEAPVDPQANELNQKKLALLKMIASVDNLETMKKLYNFFTVHFEITAHYVDEKSFGEILDLGMVGMVEGLDLYSHLFIDKAAEAFYKDFTEEENYAGAGMTIMSYHKNSFVVEVFDNSPAAKAGIQPGDSILKIDGKDIYGLDTTENNQLKKGKEGTLVTIEITGPRLQKPKTVTLVRQRVVAESVLYKELGRGIAYVKIRSFMPDKEVVARFKEVLGKAANKKLIIDLRNNGGGSLDAVNRMVGFLAGPNTILISIKGREAEQFVMTPESVDPRQPPSKIVVLINNYSASASEIMAGDLKHYKLATLVGVRTYGKATVQNYLGLDLPQHQLEGSHLIMGITVARYYLPDGTNITGNGVEPDVEIEQPDDFKPYEYLTKRDLQFQEALKLLKK